MMWMPFICIGMGALIGLVKLPGALAKAVEYTGNMALILMMLTIGINIGADDVVINSIGIIGFQCAVISLCALFFSILFVFIIEKTVLPLDKLKQKMIEQQVDVSTGVDLTEEEKKSPLVRIIPICIIAGVIAGYFLLPATALQVVDMVFYISLAILYVSIGISLMQNKGVFQYIKLLGWKIILLSIAILLGSIIGGAIAAALLGLKPHITVMAASGMCYYSLTGAVMTQTFGIQAGTYGFLVNVFREFLTVLFIPLLIKISKGAPIAAGGAADMDTLLAPISKSVGIELGFVALVTGMILTFAVPVLLPVLAQILV